MHQHATSTVLTMSRSDDIAGNPLTESALKKLAGKLRKEMEANEELPEEIQKALHKLASEAARKSRDSAES
jgi:hypothetical protein